MRAAKSTTIFVMALALAAGASAMAACGGGDDDATGGPDSAKDGGEAGLLDGATPSPDGGEAGSAPTPMDACRAYLTAACERYAECGQPMDCNNYLSFCPDYVFAPGSARTVDSVLACAEVRRTQSCADVLAGLTPDCAIPGTRHAGEPCQFSVQCDSNSCISAIGACGHCGTLSQDGGCGYDVVCDVNQACLEWKCEDIVAPKTLAPGEACPSANGGPGCPGDQPCTAPTTYAPNGVCRAAPPPAGACRFYTNSATAICAPGEYCLDAGTGQTRTCVTPGDVGQLCGVDIGVPCKPDLACSARRVGTCQPRVGLDKPCGLNTTCTKDLYCAFTTETAGTCKPRPTIGEECPNVQIGTLYYYVPCLGDLVCHNFDEGDAGTVQRCMANPAFLGEACAPPIRPCAAGLVCGSDKTCELVSCVADAGTD